MNRLLLFAIVFLTSFVVTAQQKRLALVIGNANYEKGALKNPVNDAELVAKTLDSLNFDVILKKNLEYRSQFVRAIREFGQKRAEYDVAFVYYAGHGIQVDNENFLLPTKEEFLSEDDVLDFGVSVQNVLRYLESESEKVNILILDACRDNPFEVKWNATRSLKGNGLAKIPPPTGSLIAFSTDAGSTAADGESENSVYCKSLCKNFLLEDVSIDQVFRNVRSDVLKSTNNKQRPVESSQLTGQTFYLLKPSPKLYINKIDSLILEKDYDNGIKICDISIFLYPENSILLTKRGHINSILGNSLDAYNDYTKALKLNANQTDAYFTQINFENDLSDVGIIQHLNHVELGQELNIYNKWVESDKYNPIAYQERARYYNWELDETDLALSDLNYSLELIKNTENYDNARSNYLFIDKKINFTEYLKSSVYINFSYVLEDNNNLDRALKYSEIACKINKNNKSNVAGWSYFSKASVLEKMGKLKDAESNYKIALKKMPDECNVYYQLAGIYNSQGKFLEALETLNSAISISKKSNDNYLNYSLFYRAILYYTNNNYFTSLEDLNRLDYNKDYSNSTIYLIRSLIYKDLGVCDLALRDLKKYLLSCCFYHENADQHEKWFENLPHNENFDIPDKNFYKWVYSEAQNNFPVPWKGNISLITEIKGLITSCLAE